VSLDLAPQCNYTTLNWERKMREKQSSLPANNELALVGGTSQSPLVAGEHRA